MTNPTAFLGVETSLTGRKWLGPTVELERASELIVQETDLPRALAQVLARRGVSAQEAEGFLAPQLRDLMPDPRSLKDMEKASARIVTALDKRERVAIFADYDVDGGTSAALLLDWFRALGHDATLYVPDRIDEGYGPNAPAMEMLARDHSLIICVDCGTLSHEALAAASGTDIIVLDHHLGGETLPPALAVVNPNRQDETGDLAHLCAAAVVFLTLVDAGRILREAGRKTPDLLAMLDLVALATVADVAPLIGVNRAFVVQGLKIMSRRARPGLVALSDVGRLDTAPKAYHLGFVLGPRINAGGRIGQADLGARLLSCRDPHEAKALADKLDMLNTERRGIEEEVRAAALTQAEERGFESPLVWAAGEGWHAGVVGIVASRLKESTNRPAIVIGFDGDEGKGSGRSVTGIDLGAAIQRLAMDGLIEKGGGHKMAAGLSLSRAQLEPAMARLSELLDKQGAGALGPSDLKLDGALMPGAASQQLVEQLDAPGPYGASAAGPRFAFPDCVIHFAKQIGTGHLKLTFSDGTGPRLEAIAFGAFDTALGPTLLNHGGARFHLAGRLELNTWQGRTSVQLRLDDAAPAH
jgi:single-stranded-DNA-specific exonuclease